MSENVRFVSCKNGSKTVYINNILLHSEFNPEIEAQRFITSQKLDTSIKVVILINPGLCYVIPYILALGLGIRIVILTSDNQNANLIPNQYKDILYKSPINIQELFTTYSISKLADYKLLVWKPGILVSPTQGPLLLKAIQDESHKLVINDKTMNHFGHSWLRNTCNNLLFSNFLKLEKKISGLFIIAASGPSLQEFLPDLIKYRKNFILAALPSSVCALLSFGITPDYIFQSDGGFWSLYHWQNKMSKDIKPIISLRSRFPNNMYKTAKIIPFTIDSYELDLFKYIFNVEIPKYNDHGTVAYQAISFAQEFVEGDIILLGLDLAQKTYQSHVKPHTFDYQMYLKMTRTNSLPFYPSLYEKSTEGINGYYRSPQQALLFDTMPQNSRGNIFQDGPNNLNKYIPVKLKSVLEKNDIVQAAEYSLIEKKLVDRKEILFQYIRKDSFLGDHNELNSLLNDLTLVKRLTHV